MYYVLRIVDSDFISSTLGWIEDFLNVSTYDGYTFQQVTQLQANPESLPANITVEYLAYAALAMQKKA